MAKSKKVARTVAPPESNGKVHVPDGYEKQSTDVVGFWDPETGPIHFIPLEVKLFDSKLDPAKANAIVIGKLVEATLLKAPGGEDEEIQGAAGDVVGVWYKPGMSAIKNLGGVKVYMYANGEVDTGKPNPMKLFEVLSRTKGEKLHVSHDFRDRSKNIETAFAGPKTLAKDNAGSPPEQGADDVPF